MITSFLTFHYAPIIYHAILASLMGIEYWLGKKETGPRSIIGAGLAVGGLVALKVIEAKQKLKGDK